MANLFEQTIAEIAPRAVEWRRQIHRQPELAFKEFKTAALVEKVLRDAGIQVVRYPDSTAVVGILEGGMPGKTVALRADMDALPLTEQTDLEFKSEVPGVMHACGHDVHTAILLGTAVTLATLREQVPGTVKFLFQPAEEYPPGGAKFMVENGCLEDPPVDFAFALHVGTALPTGTIGVRYDYSSANTDSANITIIGKGGHGAYPQNTIDPVVVAAHITTALQTIVSRNISALDSAVISVGSIQSGTVNNIIPETAELKLTIRSLKDETRELLKKRIEEIVAGVCRAMGADYHIDYVFGYPAVHNDSTAVDVVKAVAEELLGADNVQISSTPTMGGEDFAYFAREVPAAMFGLGAQPENPEEVYPGHNPKFKVNEDCIKIGMEMMVGIVLRASQE